MLGKKKYLVQFEYRQKRDICASSLLYLCEKEEFGQEVNETIYDLHKIGQGELLTINGDPVCEGDGMIEKMCVFYYILLFVFC